MPRIGSQEEYDSQGEQRTLMPEDDYLLEVKELSIKKDQPNPYDRTEEYPNGKPRDTAFVKFAVISFADGGPLVDKDDKPTSDRLFFDFLEIEKMGFSGAGKPSKARQFVAACLGQDPRLAIEFGDWQELVGKRLIGHGMVKRNGKQGIDAYRAMRRRGAAAQPAAPVSLPAEAPAEEPVDLQAKAQELFGEDATF